MTKDEVLNVLKVLFNEGRMHVRVNEAHATADSRLGAQLLIDLDLPSIEKLERHAPKHQVELINADVRRQLRGVLEQLFRAESNDIKCETIAWATKLLEDVAVDYAGIAISEKGRLGLLYGAWLLRNTPIGTTR